MNKTWTDSVLAFLCGIFLAYMAVGFIDDSTQYKESVSMSKEA